MSVYDEVRLEEMEFDPVEQVYYYSCPCGDQFFIGLEELYDGEDIAPCPSCSLRIRVLFDEVSFPFRGGLMRSIALTDKSICYRRIFRHYFPVTNRIFSHQQPWLAKLGMGPSRE